MAKTRISVQGKIIVVVAIILIIACTLVVGVMILMNTNFMNDQTAQGEEVKISDDILTPAVISDKVTTFLVVGVADDPSQREVTKMTDTIMVVTMDIEKDTISVLQVPRDTYVGEETPTGKINAIYKQEKPKWDYAGLDGLSTMLHKMFQINIDHYMTVQMDGFANIVDQIGGVPMDVPEDMVTDDAAVTAGQQTLNGKQALAVVRTREIYLDADIGRLNMQKNFMSALMKKCMSLGMGEMMRAVPSLYKSVKTDLTLAEALGYYEIVGKMDIANMNVMTVPGNGDHKINGQYVYTVYPNHMVKMLNTYFRPYSTPITFDQLDVNNPFDEPDVIENESQAVTQLDSMEKSAIPDSSSTPPTQITIESNKKKTNS